MALLELLSGVQLKAQDPASPATFRPASDLVLVPVLVRNHAGKTVTCLRAENFTVLDNGAPQKIKFFAGGGVPSSVGLVLDASGSMQQTLGAAKNAVLSFLKAAHPQDEFLLLTVSTEPNAMPEFTNNVASLRRLIDVTVPRGLTALTDTVYLALRGMRNGRQPEKALVILFDGLDNHSRFTSKELMRVASEADIQVYPILIANNLAVTTTESVLFRSRLVAKP